MNKEFRVFFYDGEDTSTGEMLDLQTAMSEDYVRADGCLLTPTDECTIILEFTGLLDGLKKKVFEGDVVRSGMTGRNYLIFWDEDRCAFRKQCLNENINDIDIWQDSSSIYVIGNSFENPELLKE